MPYDSEKIGSLQGTLSDFAQKDAILKQLIRRFQADKRLLDLRSNDISHPHKAH